MGIGGVSAWQLIILLLVVILLFGTRRLRNVGGDLGSALRSFRQGMSGEAAADFAPEGEGKAAGSLPEPVLSESPEKR